MNATLTYDADVKALSIQLTEADVLETVELAEGAYLDVDREGQAVGLEVLNADAGLLAGEIHAEMPEPWRPAPRRPAPRRRRITGALEGASSRWGRVRPRDADAIFHVLLLFPPARQRQGAQV